MRFQSIVFAALLAAVSSVAQSQDGVKSPRDAASGLLSVTVRASNSHVVALKDVLVSSFTSVSRSASGQTSRRQHKPIGWKMTLPAGAAPTNLSFVESSESGYRDWIIIESVVLQLVLKGATCSAAAPARYDANIKQLMVQLGDVAALFDAQGKAIAAKCNAQ